MSRALVRSQCAAKRKALKHRKIKRVPAGTAAREAGARAGARVEKLINRAMRRGIGNKRIAALAALRPS